MKCGGYGILKLEGEGAPRNCQVLGGEELLHWYYVNYAEFSDNYIYNGDEAAGQGSRN